MANYDYDELRREVADLSRSLRARKQTAAAFHADAIDGDVVGDLSAHRPGFADDEAERLMEIVRLAEAAEAGGDPAAAEAMVAQVYRGLDALVGPQAPDGARGDGYDPEPPAVPVLSLMDRAARDYRSLHHAVDNWRTRQEHALDHWVELREREKELDPASDYAETVGDPAGYRYREIDAEALSFRERIRAAQAAEHQGDVERCDELCAALIDELGLTGETAGDVQAFLARPRPRHAALSRRALVWSVVVLAVVATIAGLAA